MWFGVELGVYSLDHATYTTLFNGTDFNSAGWSAADLVTNFTPKSGGSMGYDAQDWGAAVVRG